MNNNTLIMFKKDLNFQNLDLDTQEKLLEEFDEKIISDGWEEWMEEYTEAKDGEEISEKDMETIETIQAKKFLKYKFD